MVTEHGPSPVGIQLRQLREAAGLTQEELAERAGLSVQAIGSLERGDRRHPYPHTIQALSDALGLAETARQLLLSAASRRANAGGALGQPPTGSMRQPLTPIVGRDHEIAAIGELLVGHQVRLVTLTGPGGVGKTRLATAVMTSIASHFADGGGVVALASLHSAELVLPAIAQTLGLHHTGDQGIHAVVQRVLHHRNMLLVLDNFEHLVDAAPAVADLLATCAKLSVLVTSRALLHVRGEHAYMVAPLRVPDVEQLPTVEDIAQTSAVRLFVERAQAASPGFALTRTNAAAVAAICRRVAGLPLAVELAAARVPLLSPTQLLARLDRVLPLLVGGARDLDERQRTMHRTIEWSYNLLLPGDQALLRWLAVFAGGWTLEAAETLGANRGVEVMDALGRLVDQSLVVADAAGDVMRYHLLEPMREYALDLLTAQGEAEDVQRRHADLFLDLVEGGQDEMRTSREEAWFAMLQREHDNLRAAMHWLLDRRAVDAVARFGWVLWRFWWARGYHVEGRRVMEQVMAHETHLSRLRQAQARYVLAVMLYRLESYQRPAQLFEESIALFQQVHDLPGTALALTGAGVCALRAGDLQRGVALLEASLSLFRQHHNQRDAALVLTYLGVVPFNHGRYGEAKARFAEGLALARELGSAQATYTSLYDVALAAQAQGEYAEAHTLYTEGLVLCAECDDVLYVAYYLEGLAGVAGSVGVPHCAARLFAASHSLLERTGVPLYARATSTAFLKACLDHARTQLTAAAWQEAWAEGWALTQEQAIRYALDPTNTVPQWKSRS